MRILLAEDDAMLADAISRALTQSAHVVDVASDGARADAALATDAFDLAILDIELPVFDGLEVLRRLRAALALPVLMLSVRDALGVALGGDRVAGGEAGRRATIRKPALSASSLRAQARGAR
jgi:two-component system OmpR family response regulator